MLDGVKQTAADTARRAGLMSAGAVVLCVGAAFLTGAAWLYLVAVLDALQAAVIIGLVYAGLGLILIGFGLRKPQHVPPYQAAAAPTPKAEAAPPMMQAFLYGLQAGAAADRRKA